MHIGAAVLDRKRRRRSSGQFERGEAARLTVDVHLDESSRNVLAMDVRRGLTAQRKSVPPKYFYDERGSQLFDQICDTPEYYQTRTELALLRSIAAQLVARVEPADLVELGSGAARKTRALLDAITAHGDSCRYVPFDVSETMLRSSALQLLEDYPSLSVHGVVGDYERHLGQIPEGKRRLFVFLGSTIGNFEADEAVRFIRCVTERMQPEDRFLLGVDLVKNEAVLNAAYNDAQGVTAEFNKNVLSVINRELGADFDPGAFSHVAFFDGNASQIEMHLESRRAQSVHIAALDLHVSFASGERVRTEISRKFTRQAVTTMLARAGQQLVSWFTSPDDYFALALGGRRSEGGP
jgi:L-histidine N-alpha-methyltransferase